jgi:hypothetical protein
LRFRQKNGQELDCGVAKITPDPGQAISGALTFTPLSILAAVALSSWRIHRNELGYSNARSILASQRPLWPVVVDMTGYLRYLQFAFVSASMSIEYPGFYVPAVSKLAWANLLYWRGPFNHGYAYDGPNGGMYPSNSSYGLGFMIQMLRYPNMLNTLANSLINLIIMVTPIFFLLSLSYWVFSHSSPVHSSSFLPIIKKATGTTIGLALCFFSVPLLSYISYDLILTGYLPHYRIALAILMLLIILGGSHFLIQVLDDQLDDKQPMMRLHDHIQPDGSNLHLNLIWKLIQRHVPHSMSLVQAVGIGGLQCYPLGQIFVLAACECVLFIFHMTPKKRMQSRLSTATYIAAVRLIIALSMIIFILPVTEAAKQWSGYVVLSLHGLVVLFGFLVTRVQIHDTPRHICEYGVDMDAD